MYDEGWTTWRPASMARVVGTVFFTILGVLAIFIVVRGVLEARRRERTTVTLKNIRAIGTALEEGADSSHEYPCVRSRRDLPPAMAAALTPETHRDGWGRPIAVMASAHRYVVMSLGSDGAADRRYEGKMFHEDSGDLIYSNGGWLHQPGLATEPELLPRVTDAFMEVSACAPATGGQARHYPCEFYIYLPSEAAARAASVDAMKAGYVTEVRRAASGTDWLCRATRELESCMDGVTPLERIEKAHGG